MLAINPTVVTFAGREWADVSAVAIDRVPERVIAAYGDLGPHPAFVDACEFRTVARVVRALSADDVNPPRMSEQGILEFTTARGGTDAGRVRVRLSGVLTRIVHDLGRKGGAVCTVEITGMSSDGAADPLSRTEA